MWYAAYGSLTIEYVNGFLMGIMAGAYAMKTFEYKCVLTIPKYLILELTDDGTIRTDTILDDGTTEIDTDDLRIAIQLSGGHNLLIPPKARLILTDDGSIEIEMPIEV
jgi:hypothetical protein